MSLKGVEQADRNRTSFERADCCHTVADLIDSRGPTLARLLTLEHGKPLSQPPRRSNPRQLAPGWPRRKESA
jgi:acyl-CoA reductase-like NAD-dependent aldehyde dehydrogenase